MANHTKQPQMPTPQEALPGRATKMAPLGPHFVNHNAIQAPFPTGMASALFGLGCFWGAEHKFWEMPGVFTTAVGYTAGFTPNPNYKEVCSGLSGHNEAVFVVYNPEMTQYEQLLELFWNSHDPTQGMRQGNDIGTQYRSGIYSFSDEQYDLAVKSKDLYQQRLTAAGYGTITTEILSATEFYYAEDYHQQYLAKNPSGYCGLGGLNV